MTGSDKPISVAEYVTRVMIPAAEKAKQDMIAEMEAEVNEACQKIAELALAVLADDERIESGGLIEEAHPRGAQWVQKSLTFYGEAGLGKRLAEFAGSVPGQIARCVKLSIPDGGFVASYLASNERLSVRCLGYVDPFQGPTFRLDVCFEPEA